jgi:ribosomal protein S27AE
MKAHPPAACPKCGDTVFLGPHYLPPKQSHPVGPERLEWECSVCRFKMSTPTLESLANGGTRQP